MRLVWLGCGNDMVDLDEMAERTRDGFYCMAPVIRLDLACFASYSEQILVHLSIRELQSSGCVRTIV